MAGATQPLPADAAGLMAGRIEWLPQCLLMHEDPLKQVSLYRDLQAGGVCMCLNMAGGGQNGMGWVEQGGDGWADTAVQVFSLGSFKMCLCRDLSVLPMQQR